MRLLLFSDLHLRKESAATVQTVLTGILAAAELYKVDRIAFLGDFWHNVSDIPADLLEMARSWLEAAEQSFPQRFTPGTDGTGRVWMLVGNHDRESHGINALRVFEKHARVIWEPTFDTDTGIWMPWQPKAQLAGSIALCRTQATADQSTNRDVMFGHFAVAGAMRNDHIVDSDGLDLGGLQGMAKVLLGHYHKPHYVPLVGGGTAEYIGSPWQTRADEAGQPKGYAIWDTKTRELTRYATKWGPEYARLTATVAGEMDLSSVQPETRVRVVAPDEAAAKLARAQLLAKGVKDFVVVPQQVLAAGAQATVQAPNLAGFMAAYAEKKIGDEQARAEATSVLAELVEATT